MLMIHCGLVLCWETVNNFSLVLCTILHLQVTLITLDYCLLLVVLTINKLKQFSQVLLMGDFNAPRINWEDLDYTGSASSFASDLLDATNDVHLFQHVTGFTRHRSGQRPSLLDLVFTSNSNSIQSIQHCSPLGSGNHNCLTWQYECLFEKTTVEGLSYNYWKGNYAAISEEFNETHWDLLLSNDDIEIN